MPDDPDRVTVSTYVPASQRDRWREDADALGMSQSEFVRSMVQAGRRGFSIGGPSTNPVEPDLPGSPPRGDGLRTTVLEVLRREEFLDWDELVQSLTVDIEDRLEESLDELLADNRITYNGRKGGYAVVGDNDGE